MKIIIIIIKEKKIKSQTARGDGISERPERQRDDFYFYIFQIYENRTVDFHRSRRQSWSMRRELRVCTKSLAFRQTPKGREFSYLCYF